MEYVIPLRINISLQKLEMKTLLFTYILFVWSTEVNITEN